MKPAQFPAALIQGLGRDLDRVVDRRPPPAQSLQHPTRLSSATAAKFGYYKRRGRQLGGNGLGILPQQTFICPEQAVLGQDRDDIKKRGAHLIIEILRRNFFLAFFRQAAAHISGKLSDSILRLRCSEHSSPRS